MSGGSSGKTVTTIYQDGPDDSLIVKDGYEGSQPYAGTKTGTSYDALRTAAIDAVEQLKQHSDDLKTETAEINKNISISREAPNNPLSSNEGFKRMSGSDGSILGSLNNLSTSVGSLFNLSPSDSSIVSGGSKISTDISLTDINSVLGIINKLSNGNYKETAKDSGATTTLIKTATSLASNNGINNTYQALVKNEELDRSILIEAAKESIKDTVAVGNINLVLDVSKAGLLGDVVLKEPSIIKTILSSNFVSPVSINDKKLLFNSLFDSFQLSGLSWNKTNNNLVEITDINVYDLSEDILSALLKDITTTPLTVFAGNENTKNAAIDKQLTDPTLPDILSIVYNDLSFDDKLILTDLWLSLEHKKLMEIYKTKVDYYLGSLFVKRTVNDDLVKDYYFTYKTLTNSVSRTR
jgi:hypothetical protein